jgi:hypothetical protein
MREEERDLGAVGREGRAREGGREGRHHSMIYACI